jgi:hypothetical protein
MEVKMNAFSFFVFSECAGSRRRQLKSQDGTRVYSSPRHISAASWEKRSVAFTNLRQVLGGVGIFAESNNKDSAAFDYRGGHQQLPLALMNTCNNNNNAHDHNHHHQLSLHDDNDCFLADESLSYLVLAGAFIPPLDLLDNEFRVTELQQRNRLEQQYRQRVQIFFPNQ